MTDVRRRLDTLSYPIVPLRRHGVLTLPPTLTSPIEQPGLERVLSFTRGTGCDRELAGGPRRRETLVDVDNGRTPRRRSRVHDSSQRRFDAVQQIANPHPVPRATRL